MNIKKLASSISKMRIKHKLNVLDFEIKVLFKNRIIEHFEVEGVYNQLKQNEKFCYNGVDFKEEHNYHLCIFNKHDKEHFMCIKGNTSKDLINMFIYCYTLNTSTTYKRKYFSIKIKER